MIGLVGAHGDTFELLDLTEEVLDEVAPLVDVGVDLSGRGPAGMLSDDDLRAAGYTHYNFGQGPDIARVIEGYLVQPTSKATQFTP